MQQRGGRLPGNFSGDLEGMRKPEIHPFCQQKNQDGLLGFLCGLLFDINFPATCRIILEKQYVERIIRRIPYGNKETEQKMKKLGEMVTEWLEEKAEG